MSLSKKVVLTVSGYKTSLSDSLQFYQNDQLKLIFEINKCGIDVASSFTHKTLMPLQPLTATLFIETPLGVDSIESANIEDNAVTFYLTSNQTQHIGTSTMQIKLTDDDGCQITLPSFTFEVQKNIYDNAVHVSGILLADENGNVLSDENGNTINATATTESSKQIKDFSLKTGVSGQEDILVQDNGVTKRIKSSELMDSVDLSNYATKAELNTKANASHSHSYSDLSNKPIIPDLTGYATETFVANKIAEASLGGEVDLSNYSTKDDLSSGLATKANVNHSHNQYLTAIPTEYITETELNVELSTKANVSDIPSLDGYATETFVTNKIAEASLSGGEVDLSGYATKEELNTELAKKANTEHVHSYNDLTNKPTIPSITGLATKEELNTKANSAHTHRVSDVTDLVIPRKTSDLTNDSGFITAIPDEYITETELNNKNYATETFVTNKIAEAQLGGGSGGGGESSIDTTITTSSCGFNSDGSLDDNSAFTHTDTYIDLALFSDGTIMSSLSGWWMFIYYDSNKKYIGSYNPGSQNSEYDISDIHSRNESAVYLRASVNKTTTIAVVGVYSGDSSSNSNTIEKNVKDYGVVGDGITDDSNFIQGLINHVGKNGGGTIIFPEGEYKISYPISIKYSNIYLKGEIGNKLRYYGSGIDVNFISVKGGYDNKLNNVTIDGLNLDATNQLYKGGADDSDWLLTAPNPLYSGMSAIYCTYCSNLKIINNKLNDFYGNGIVIKRCSFTFVEKNFLTDCSASGMASIDTDSQGDGISAFMSFGVTVRDNIIINKRTFKSHNEKGWNSLNCDVYGKQCARSGLEFEYALNVDYADNPERWCPYSDLISDVFGYALTFKNNYVYGYNKGIHLEHSINALIESNSILHCNIGLIEATGGHIMIVNNEFDSDNVGASPQGGYDWYYASIALPHFLGTSFNNAIITGNRFRGDAAGVCYGRNYISIKNNDFRNTGFCIEQKGDNLENILIEDNKILLQDTLSSGTEKRILSLYTIGKSSIKNNNFVCENYHGTIYVRMDSSVISGNVFKNVKFDLSLYNQYNLNNIFSNNVCSETIITDTQTEFNVFGSHNSVISNNTFRGTKSICKAGGDNCVLENNIYIQDNNSLPADRSNADTVGGYTIWVGNQSEYDAISSKDVNTVYLIKG